MDLIHANSEMIEQGVVTDFKKFDCQIKGDSDPTNNTFELTMPIQSWKANKILSGHFLYVDGTEFGGLVRSVKKDTRTHTITIGGLTWRGLLANKIIVPPTGSAYLVFTSETPSNIIRSVVGTFYKGIYAVEDAVDMPSISCQFRYQTVLYGLSNVFSKSGLSLSIRFDATQGKCILKPRRIVDYSKLYDVSEDLGVNLTIKTGGTIVYNHVIALGRGELEERDVVERWLHNGTIYSSRPSGMYENEEQTAVYDYPSVESITELENGAEEYLRKYQDTTTIDVDVSDVVDIDMLLDDTITVLDRDMDVNVVKRVLQKVLTITGQYEKIETEVS